MWEAEERVSSVWRKVCNLVEAFKMYTNVTVETISLTRDDRMVTFRVKMV
jgi:hypothetical protein